MWNILSRVYNSTMSAFQSSQVSHAAAFTPTVADVFQVKEILHAKPTSNLLPIEIIDIIIDQAEYWPHTTSNYTHTAHGSRQATGSVNEDVIVSRSAPLGYPDEDNTDIIPWRLDWAGLAPFAGFYTQKGEAGGTDRNYKLTNVLKNWEKLSKPRGKHPCRKIVFKIKSHDQGWGGDHADRGTFNGSYTWFDAGIERIDCDRANYRAALTGQLMNLHKSGYSLRTIRPETMELPEMELDTYGNVSNLEDMPNPDAVNGFLERPFLPPPTCLQRNKTATRETQDHTVTWSWNDRVDPELEDAEELEAIGRGAASATGEFVRSLKIGDLVTVWGRARFGGWANVVESLTIEVYWAV